MQMISRALILLGFAAALTSPRVAARASPPQERGEARESDGGWTELRPSPGAKHVYVSASEGKDGQAGGDSYNADIKFE